MGWINSFWKTFFSVKVSLQQADSREMQTSIVPTSCSEKWLTADIPSVATAPRAAGFCLQTPLSLLDRLQSKGFGVLKEVLSDWQPWIPPQSRQVPLSCITRWPWRHARAAP